MTFTNSLVMKNLKETIIEVLKEVENYVLSLENYEKALKDELSFEDIPILYELSDEILFKGSSLERKNFSLADKNGEFFSLLNKKLQGE